MLPRCPRPQVSNKEATGDPNAYAYIDVPQFCYSDWLTGLGTNPIGSAPSPAKPVLIIGAGVSGACAAYELAKAGVPCVVVDAEGEIGGRCASTRLPANQPCVYNPNLVELGAMRFPASESIMDFYVKKFNILGNNQSFVNPANVFPDPGKVNTIFAADGDVLPEIWKEPAQPPAIFANVTKGWTAVATRPLVRRTPYLYLMGMEDLTKLLQAGRVSEAKAAWQLWVDTFEQQTFYGAMFDLMTGRNGWIIPGGDTLEQDGTPWTFDDFDRFGQLGVGSGGFGSLYPINFPEIMRLIVDGLESTQYFFPPGIRSLPYALMNAAMGNDSSRPVKTNAGLFLSTMITRVEGEKGAFTVKTKDGNARLEPLVFSRVLVATTTRSMECTMNIAGATRPEYPPGQCGGTPVVAKLLSDEAANAVRRVHTTSSIKVAAQIKKFWKDDASLPRCFLSDDIIRQIYTLDYGDPNTAVCFITYTWDDDAIRQQGLGVSLDATMTTTQDGLANNSTYAVDKVKLYKTLHSRLLYLAGQNCSNQAFVDFVNGLYPYDTKNPLPPPLQDYPADAILYVEWQSLPSYNAAFKLSEPGQDKYVQNEFFDYKKAGDAKLDTGVYLAGDTIGWTAGWVEGALYTALNAASGLLVSLNGTVNNVPQRSGQMVQNPMLIDQNFFNYFVPGVTEEEEKKKPRRSASKRARDE